MKIILMLIATFTITSAKAIDVDTQKILLNSKKYLFEYIDIFGSMDDFEFYLNYQPEYKFVQSSGFDDVIFYYIDVSPITRYIDSQKMKVYFKFMRYRFYFGYRIGSNDIYRLKGFKNNEFTVLYSTIAANYEMEHGVAFTFKEFIKNYSIEGLDLKCLYKCLWLGEEKSCDCIEEAKVFYNGKTY